MKLKLIISTLALLLTYYFSVAQFKCGMDEILHQYQNEQLYIPPSLKDSANLLKPTQQRDIDTAQVKQVKVYNNYPLQNLPGFQPTGDNEADQKELIRIKEELYNDDPEQYKQMTRNPNPIKTDRTQKKQ